jgi:hypothetical protein
LANKSVSDSTLSVMPVRPGNEFAKLFGRSCDLYLAYSEGWKNCSVYRGDELESVLFAVPRSTMDE